MISCCISKYFIEHGHTYICAGINSDQPTEEAMPSHISRIDYDQPTEDPMPSRLSRMVGSCSGFERGGNYLEGLDAVTREQFGDLIPDRTVREYVSNIIKSYFEDCSVLTQAQILHGLIKHKKLKNATKLLGFQDASSKKAREHVTENISNALSSFGKSRKVDIRAARRAITTAVVTPRTSTKHQIVATMSKLLHVSRKTLHKYTKFRVRIDENDEATCWAFICRQPYRDRLPENVREQVIEFWDRHSRAIPDQKHVLRKRLSKGVYAEHCKHVMEMTGVALFEEFQETNPHVKIAISMFNKLKPWYIKPNTIRDTCCCRYHVDFEYHYDTFIDLYKRHWNGEQPPPTVRDFISMILCKRNPGEMFYSKKCVDGICPECGDLALFHRNFHVDLTQSGLSDITVTWKRYEYITNTASSSSTVSSKRIDLVDDEIPCSEFMEKFQNQIYKYIKHSHRSRWQASRFKQSREVFEPGTILSVVDFAENYTFAPQKEIQSEYYHSDQVSIFVHVLYRHAQMDIDGIDSTHDLRHVIKEYHFYVSDDREHDTLFVQHCFGLMYESFRKKGVSFTEHWIWSDGCAGQFKSARSFYWLSHIHKEIGVRHTWSFFETGHGKGEHDGAGACVKRALRRYQMSHDATRLKSSKEVVDWCTLHLGHEGHEQERPVRR